MIDEIRELNECKAVLFCVRSELNRLCAGRVKLVTEIDRLKALNEWQPIEIAVKNISKQELNKNKFLLNDPSYGVVMGAYCPDTAKEEGVTGWFCTNEQGWATDLNPTHLMRVPQTPERED